MKTTCRKYIIRPDQYGSWCEFLIFDDGLVVIHTDNMSAVNRWCNWTASSFIEWILELLEFNDRSYFLNKMFGNEIDNIYRADLTEAHVKRIIRDALRSRSCDIEEAREEYDLTELLYNTTPDEWVRETKMKYAWNKVIYDYPKKVYDIWEKFIPQLIVEIKDELLLEKESVKND